MFKMGKAAAFLLTFGLALAGCATTPGPSQPESSKVAITIENFSFGDPVTAKVGDTIVVTNEDGVAHTWTAVAGTFDSGPLSSGESFEFSFDQPGEYAFFCSIHPSMKGTITVSG